MTMPISARLSTKGKVQRGTYIIAERFNEDSGLGRRQCWAEVHNGIFTRKASRKKMDRTRGKEYGPTGAIDF